MASPHWRASKSAIGPFFLIKKTYLLDNLPGLTILTKNFKTVLTDHRRFDRSMPIYEYECEKCGRIEEALQRFSAKPLTKCKHCSGRLHKLISQSSFHLKGTGWYVTDYADKSKSSAPSETKKKETTDTSSTKSKKSTDKSEWSLGRPDTFPTK